MISATRAQVAAVNPPATTRPLTPLGWYGVGALGCAIVSPMVGTLIAGRELTVTEVDRMALSCFLGPVGWLLGPVLFPEPVLTPNPPPGNPPPPQGPRPTRARHIDIPGRSVTAFLPDEILMEVEAGTPDDYLNVIGRNLQLTRLETLSFTLTGRTLQRWHINGGRSVIATLRDLSPFGRISAAQPNFLYRFGQAQPPAQADAAAAQYVVPKMHLVEAHRVTNGDDVLVAVIDSKIDTSHPDLAGVIAEQYDALGGAAPAHAHGTGMAGAIAAHAKLIGVAPKVKLLAIRAFSGEGDSAQGTTFTILKGLDWAANKNARIVNMSFAGPPDPMFRDMLSKAHARGIVLIAAVGNAGPKSPPLYPAADPDVIGVTATDADDHLLTEANRGSQVAVAAPGVMVLVPAPDDKYALTTGTSVASAHVTGVAALLLAADPKLTPDQVRRDLIRSARKIPGSKRDVGAGVVDALTAVNEVKK
jgi:hypothetical protein